MISESELKKYSSTALAFVGDAVFTLAVRARLTSCSLAKSGKLHEESNKYINAVNQSRLLTELEEMLTTAEQEVVRRGRNAYTNNKAKAAGLGEYADSTAYEALLGYLYLSGNENRLNELLGLALKGARV
ncbi:MAG: ribonuclease III [Firmicutes bacterium]|nr:ribonuclease III [Bacillota bacterium]